MLSQELISKSRSYLPPDRIELIERAYAFAHKAHKDQKRLSGEPFIEHPLQTALFLAELHLDATTIAAALLHDVIEDCAVTLPELQGVFGSEVATLVDGVTKLNKMDLLASESRSTPRTNRISTADAASLRKMLVAMAQDVRVVLIKLADRLHNLRTLKALPAPRRRVIAQETLDIFAPLADRLGIHEIQWRLEDHSLRYLDPPAYKALSQLVKTKRVEREQYIDEVKTNLQKALLNAGVDAQVSGRPKHLYSVYQKMQKYTNSGKEFGQIYDLMALRVLVNTVRDCYDTLGIIHGLWRPLPGQFDDYIANPKDNLYQSLHTTVMCTGNIPLEAQIRTFEQHRVAEYGVAAHWQYKDSSVTDQQFEHTMNWLRQLLEWQREVSGPEDFLEGLKLDVFRHQVFVYTPRGEVKELPAGATCLDFAYRVHTELGHRCVGGKVNGNLVPLNSRLENGDTVEVLTTKSTRGPSLDWLNPNLGYINTASAREKICQWFRKQKRSDNIDRGRQLLEKEFQRLPTSTDASQVASLMGIATIDDLFAMLGTGTLGMHEVAFRLATQSKTLESLSISPMPTSAQLGPSSGVNILGVGELLTNMARCCSPVPGDSIVGFLTRTRGVAIHNQHCSNVRSAAETERLISVTWGPRQELYPLRLRIDAWDRVGLLRDLSTVASEEKVNIASVVTKEDKDNRATILLTLYTSGLDQLSRLCAKLEGAPGVISVTRTSLPRSTP